MLSEEQIKDGWIEHDGGPCPVDPDTLVTLFFAVAPAFVMTYPADCFEWDAPLAYRPATPME